MSALCFKIVSLLPSARDMSELYVWMFAKNIVSISQNAVVAVQVVWIYFSTRIQIQNFKLNSSGHLTQTQTSCCVQQYVKTWMK